MRDPNESRPPPAPAWPELPLDGWRDTYATLHMWTQVIGKIRLSRAPMVNHWWQVALYVTSRGLTTSPIPDGPGTFQIDFDFVDHRLVLGRHTGERREIALEPMTVADFHARVMEALHSMGIDARIWTRPVEVEDPIPFERDRVHGAYDPDAAHRFWVALVQADRVLNRFRSEFLGKCSPVHFFWGSFDLAVTRFSGRRAPPHPGGVPSLADWVTREAYSHECSSCGFWPGSGAMPAPAFYSYAYPEPPGLPGAPVRPAQAYYHGEMREFILPYDDVRAAADPDALLLAFLRSTYEAEAELGGWDRTALERGADPLGAVPGVPEP